MEEKRRWSLLERAIDVVDLPGDVVAGMVRVELIGGHTLRVENHRGVLFYGREEIGVSGGKLLVRIKGTELEIRAMSADALLITGNVSGVELS